MIYLGKIEAELFLERELDLKLNQSRKIPSGISNWID
jgi:hypothetical protein